MHHTKKSNKSSRRGDYPRKCWNYQAVIRLITEFLIRLVKNRSRNARFSLPSLLDEFFDNSSGFWARIQRVTKLTWIALHDRSSTTPKGANKARCSPDGTNTKSALLSKGSLVVDFNFSLDQKAPCKLVHYSADHDWARRFTIYLNADYSLSVEARQGISSSYVRLADIDLREAGAVRLTYAWNSPEKLGLLSAENEEDGSIHQAIIHAPIPLPLGDANNIVRGLAHTTYDNRTLCLALSDKVVPVGPAPSITAGAMVETGLGPQTIERLRLGDLVQTKDNGLQPVRWIVKQDLPAIGRSTPMRLRAPFFGLTKDLMVTCDQRVLIAGIDTEYNLGQDAVLIEAKSLIGHPAAAPLSGSLSTTFYQVLLDSHECINVSGAWADSLYVGHLKNTPQIAATTCLSEIPTAIFPIHRTQTHPVLRDYERQALLDTLIA